MELNYDLYWDYTGVRASGYATWEFEFGTWGDDDWCGEFAFAGMFSEARKAAEARARKLGFNGTIYLLPGEVGARRGTARYRRKMRRRGL